MVNRSHGYTPEEIFLSKATLDPTDKDYSVDIEEIRNQLKSSAEREINTRNKSRAHDRGFKQGDYVLLPNRKKRKWIRSGSVHLRLKK